MSDGKTVEEYTVVADEVPAKIEIRDEDDYVKRYRLKRPQPSAATEAILDEIKRKTIAEADVSTESFEDSNEMAESRRIFRSTAEEILGDQLPGLDDSKVSTLIGNLIHSMLGLGDVEILLKDNDLEEIVINNSKEPAWAYHKEYGWLKTDITFESESQIYNYASEVGRGVGKSISSLHPMLDAHLPSGDRTNATISPISTKGNTITIRKFARDPWTITDFIKIGSISAEMAAFLWLCIQYEMNVIVSGGTGSGKCLTPSSKLTMADGTRKSISNVVERNLENEEKIEDGVKADAQEELFSMSKDNSIDPATADKVWKRDAPGEMYRIKTKSGRSIETTAEHPFFINREGRVEKSRADEVEVGDFIPTPRKLEVENKDSRLEIEEWVENKGLSWNEGWVSGTRSNSIKIPEYVNENLGEFAGLVVGDGHIQEEGKSSCRVELNNSDDQVLSHFENISEKIFGVETSRKVRDERVNKSDFHSHVATRFLNEKLEIPVGKKSGRIKIPSKIVESSDETLAGFFRGYFEAEAHVNVNKSNIEITSKSEEVIEQTLTGLKRFDVYSRIEKRDKEEGTYHRLIIGPEYLEEYQSSVDFISESKQEALKKAINSPNNTNVDVVPSEEILRKVKESSSLYDRELAEKADISRRAVSRYLEGTRKPSRKAFEKIVKAVESRKEELEEIKKNLEDLDLSGPSRKEARDEVLKLINEGKVERKSISSKSEISDSLITYWKQGSMPGSEKLHCVTQAIKKEGLELDYEPVDYRKVFNQIKVIRKDLKVSPTELKEETGIDIGVYESGKRETTRKRVNQIINYLKNECEWSIEKLSEELNHLERIGNPDIVWDEVKEIEKFEPKSNHVYDLTVPDKHTFVAEDLVAHNTSLLNVLTPFMPPSQRILSIEDTRELSLPEFLHWVPMTTREENPDGEGGVNMQDLLVNSLRMRPDRILVGEIREKEQAEVLFEAMQTGHSVYSTLHADTAETTLKRMTNPPIDVPEAVVGAVDLNVVMFRDRRRNFRRVLEVAEVIENDENLNAHTIYDWNSQEDRFYKQDNSNEIMDKLKMVTGLSQEEIDDNVDEKQMILEWMVDNDVDELEEVGRVIAEYYSGGEEVIDKIREGVEPEQIIPVEEENDS